eukprot:6457924-Amphidinium_carterae.2
MEIGSSSTELQLYSEEWNNHKDKTLVTRQGTCQWKYQTVCAWAFQIRVSLCAGARMAHTEIRQQRALQTQHYMDGRGDNNGAEHLSRHPS